VKQEPWLVMTQQNIEKFIYRKREDEIILKAERNSKKRSENKKWEKKRKRNSSQK
jgi:hypothetical protein